MLEIIFVTMVLYVVQLLLPASLAFLRKEVNVDYLVGARDTQPELSPLVNRAKRAVVNLQESLLIFMPLAVLALVGNVNVAETAAVWLGLRLAYLVTYLMGLKHVRTLIWTGTLICFYFMGAALV